MGVTERGGGWAMGGEWGGGRLGDGQGGTLAVTPYQDHSIAGSLK